jgi:Nif-specific regulatory protein
LFLDEIGELPLNLQAKLLRVLQEKEIQRLGDIKRKSVDFRLITATNKDLKKLMEEGKFREDLYYRIVVSQIYLPPLRERKEEIISLSNLIISKNLKNFDLKSYKIDPFFYKAIEERDWKGNVRELENYIVSIMANLEEGGIISLKEGFSQKREETYKLKGNYHQILNDFKKQIIEEALKKAKNNRKEAAKLLGITPQALGYIIRELKMVK